MRIAYLEDDKDQADVLCAYFEAGNLDYTYFSKGQSLLDALAEQSFDVYILDWHLPDIVGGTVLTTLREKQPNAGVIFVTREDDQHIIVSALEAGADDYMVKPISHRELFARINAVSRRKKIEAIPSVLDYPPYRIDSKTRKVYLFDDHVQLTQKEYDLTLYLFSHVNQILPRSELLENVWGTSPDINTRRVDTHISRLRNKLEINDSNGWCLHSIYQHGYRLEMRS